MSDLGRDAIKAECRDRVIVMRASRKVGDVFTAGNADAMEALLAALKEAEWERDDLKVTLAELMPDPVLFEGSWIPVAELPKYARESKAMWLRAESAERRIAAVEAILDDPGGPDSWSHTYQGRHAVFADDVRSALHPVAETTERME